MGSAPADLVRAVPRDVRDLCAHLRSAGARVWLVGGSVRDLLRGETPAEWDLCTDARPERVMEVFRRAVPTGVAHGTVTVIWRDVPYEVTTLRGERGYSDGRHPDEVRFVDDIDLDLARRDFTVNAIALDPATGDLVDPFGGRRDVEARVLRAVGDPRERFAEDGLRVLRAARLHATLEYDVDPATLAAIAPSLGVFRKVSAERVRDEWLKAMRARRPSRAFELMRETGLLEATVPELCEAVGCEQNRWHAWDVWRHTMACLDACDGGPLLRVAALLHDVAKPRTRARSEEHGDWTFYGHERVGAEMADRILERLRFSNAERGRAAALVRHHLVCYSDEWSDAAVRRWLRRVSPDLVDQLLLLARADALGKGRDVAGEIDALGRLRARVADLRARGAAIGLRDLAVDGDDLLRELGLQPGRLVGETLRHLLDQVLEDPERNERDRLIEAARQFIASRSS